VASSATVVTVTVSSCSSSSSLSSSDSDLGSDVSSRMSAGVCVTSGSSVAAAAAAAAAAPATHRQQITALLAADHEQDAYISSNKNPCCLIPSHKHIKFIVQQNKLEFGPMPNVMVALPNTGGALCSTPQSLADAHY